MRAVAVDALVVSHLPNIRYLTGFVGTAGLVVLTPTACFADRGLSIPDGARRRSWRTAEMAAEITVVVPSQSYDETLAAVLRESGARRIGIEAAWMPVSRFNRLAVALAASAPTPLRSPDACPVLLPTERIVESQRVVKDETEIATFAKPGAVSAPRYLRQSGWCVPAGQSRKWRPRSTRCSGATVSSGRHSRRSSPPDRTAHCRTRGRAIGG